jgi:membrane-associated phospholipid phosphatase
VAFAISRPYLGVHYPSDVVAGAVLGTAIAEGWPS